MGLLERPGEDRQVNPCGSFLLQAWRSHLPEGVSVRGTEPRGSKWTGQGLGASAGRSPDGAYRSRRWASRTPPVPTLQTEKHLNQERSPFLGAPAGLSSTFSGQSLTSKSNRPAGGGDVFPACGSYPTRQRQEGWRGAERQ